MRDQLTLFKGWLRLTIDIRPAHQPLFYNLDGLLTSEKDIRVMGVKDNFAYNNNEDHYGWV